MGLVEMFGSEIICPACNNRGAKKLLWSIHCPNPECDLGTARRASGVGRRRLPEEWPVDPMFQPGSETISIRYRNFLSEERTFTGDRRTLERRGQHFTLRVSPSGQRIALWRERILNLADVEPHARPATAVDGGPKSRDRQILAYHRKNGTTSPALEEVLRRHPDWR